MMHPMMFGGMGMMAIFWLASVLVLLAIGWGLLSLFRAQAELARLDCGEAPEQT